MTSFLRVSEIGRWLTRKTQQTAKQSL